MTKNTLHLLILTALCLTSSCVTRKNCEKRFPQAVHDSLIIHTNTQTIYKDTTVFVRIPGDTVEKVIELHSTDLTDSEISILNTERARSFAWIKAGKLHHRLIQKDSVLEQKIKNAIRTTSHTANQEKIIYKTQKVNELTGLQWVQIYLGRLFALALMGWLIITICLPKRRV